MLLRLAAFPNDWHRVVTRLELAGSPALAGVVRTLLPASEPANLAETAVVPIAFTQQQAEVVQIAAMGIGLRLLATPIADRFDPAPGTFNRVGNLTARTAPVHEGTR